MQSAGKLVPVFFLVHILSGEALAASQSAVITLVFPSEARSLGMGDVGTALADDESVLFFNPAGLGMPNRRWRSGAVSRFWERLLPALHLPDLYHLHYGVLHQGLLRDFGGFGLDINGISFGENTLVDEEGVEIARFHSWEGVVTVGWGFNLEDLGIRNHSWGVSLKYVHSALAPGMGEALEGQGQTFAVDVGYLWRFGRDFRFGVNLANMGPPIFYVDRAEADPLPFTVNAAVACDREFVVDNVRFLGLSAEVRAAREIAKNYVNSRPDPFWKAVFTDFLNDTSSTWREEMSEIIIHAGAEVRLLNTIAYRFGFLFDWVGERYELHQGFGFSLIDHVQIDVYSIHSPEGYFKDIAKHWCGSDNESHRMGSHGARHRQYGFSLTVFRLGEWGFDDHQWWKVR